MKIWQKVLLGFLLVIALISLGGVRTSQDYERILTSFQDVKDKNLAALDLVTQMERDLKEMDGDLWKFGATGNRSYLNHFQEGRKEWVLQAQQLQNVAENEIRIQALYYKVERLTEAWIEQSELAAREVRPGKKIQFPSLSGVEPVYQDLLKQLRNNLDESFESSLTEVERGGTQAWVIRAIAVAVGLITCWAVVRSVKKPMDRLVRATGKIAAGRFDAIQQKSDDELGLLTKSFNEMSLALKERTEALEEQRRLAVQANQLKTEFLANTSHELRTPLNTIMGYSQLILDGLARSEKEEKNYLATIRQSSKHLLSLINDVLDIARIEAGQMTLDLGPVSVSQVFRQVHENMQLPAMEKKIQLRVQLPEKDLLVHAHPDRLAQVLFNLVGNAVKFTPSGEITVDAKKDPDQRRICFTVRDSGMGIPSEKQERLFQKFVQVDGSATRHFGGAGLGLSLSKTLLEIMGGDIQLSSEGEGKGVVVTFSLAEEKMAGNDSHY